MTIFIFLPMAVSADTFVGPDTANNMSLYFYRQQEHYGTSQLAVNDQGNVWHELIGNASATPV